MTTPLVLDLFLIGTVLAASAYDLALRRIPNRLLLAALLSAAALHLASGAPFTLVSTGLAGLAIGLLMFLPLYALRGMAAGDVKLMATVGAFCGPWPALEICLLTFVIGGLLGLSIVIAQGRLREAWTNVRVLLRPLYMRVLGVPLVREPLPAASVGGMPYGVAIALGTLAVLYGRHS
jgi:prepilin peptidase CpaA